MSRYIPYAFVGIIGLVAWFMLPSDLGILIALAGFSAAYCISYIGMGLYHAMIAYLTR